MGASIADPLDSNTANAGNQLRNGMSYSGNYAAFVMPVPNVAPPTPRQSFAQQHMIHNYQSSKYISTLRYFGLRPDYPAFHGFKIINGAPTVSNTGNPTLSNPPMNFPRPSKAFGMRPVSRFTKALPVSLNAYNPPTYSGNG